MEERSRLICRAAILAAVLAAAAFTFASDAQAVGVTDGCGYYNGRSGDIISDSLAQGGFDAGDKITYTLTPASANTIVVSFLRIGGAASETTYPGLNTVRTETFEIPSSGHWQLTLTSTSSASFHYELACTPAGSGSGAGSSEATNSEGYSNTVRSAARSQTEVLEKNLDSRIDAAFQAAAGRDFGGPAGTVGQPFAAVARSHAAAKASFLDGPTLRSRSTTLRELALLGSFDTSRMRLGAAANDSGGDPAKGTRIRAVLDTPKPYTLWGHGTYVSLDNDFKQGGTDNRYNGDAWGYTLGFDFRANPRLIAGISLGYTASGIATTYNSGSFDETGWNFAPYVIARPVEGLTLSAVAGLGRGDVDQTQSGASGDTESSMWFLALRGSYKVQPVTGTPLDVTGRLGLLAGHKTVDAFRLSNGTAVNKSVANTRRLKPGVELAYAFDAAGAKVQPFVTADLIYDFKDEVNGDKQAIDLGGGLRIASAGTGLSGTLSMDRQFARRDYKAFSVNGMVAYAFALDGDKEESPTMTPFVSADLHAEGSQTLGGGLRFARLGVGIDCELKITHVLYAIEDDDDDGDLTRGETRVMLRTKIDF